MYPLAVLTGDHINKGFFYQKMYTHFARPKKLAAIMRSRPYYQGGHKSEFHCTKIL